MNTNMGLNGIPQNTFNKKPDMSKPKQVKPKKYEKSYRSMPGDNVLKHYKGRLTREYTPKSAQMQIDAHTALKTISIAENKPIREVINDMIEEYIHNMSESERKLVIPQVKASQINMP